MNKTELVAALAKKTDLSKSKAEEVVNALLDTITASLKKGDEVKLIGFGTFAVRARKAQTGRNPRTGAPIKIAASKQPKFAAGKALKDAVNKR